MVARHNELYLQDILNSIAAIREDSAGLMFDELVDDRRRVRSIIYSLAVIGEAVNKIDREVLEHYSDVPWKDIISMCNRTIHEYWEIDDTVLYEVVHNDLPLLETTVRVMVQDLSK